MALTRLVMSNIKIDGVDYPFLFSLRAIKDYQEKLMKEAKNEDESSNSVDEVTAWIELGLKYGSINKGSIDEGYSALPAKSSIENWMDVNFEDACEIAALCRQKLVRFNQALTGAQMQSNVDNGQAKKRSKFPRDINRTVFTDRL